MSIIPHETNIFDSIKHIDVYGDERWSARELMAALGYENWQNFETVIDRAIAAAENQGQPVETLFTAVSKKGAGRPQRDYDLTRFAAYLVAMNGDPRKEEIATAQAYFAVQTRRAETAQPSLDLTSLDGIAALAAAAQQAVAEARVAMAKVAELEPKAEHTDMLRSSDGKLTIPDVFVQIKTHAATNYPDVRIYQADVFDLAGDLGICIRGNTIRNNQTTARALEAGWAVPADHQYPDSKGRWHTSYVTHLTHRGAGRLWDAAIKNIKTYGAVRAPKKDVAA